MLNYITPDFVHVLYKGRIVRSGGSELAAELEARGYDWITSVVDQETAAPASA
jgi:Fe-S cluster assembly ATP-binding protein